MADNKDKDNEKGKGILSGIGNTLNEITKFFDVDLKTITKDFFDFKKLGHLVCLSVQVKV
jgi:hypothetical protein